MPLNRILQKKKTTQKVSEWYVSPPLSIFPFSSSLGISLNLLGEEYKMIFKSYLNSFPIRSHVRLIRHFKTTSVINDYSLGRLPVFLWPTWIKETVLSNLPKSRQHRHIFYYVGNKNSEIK